MPAAKSEKIRYTLVTLGCDKNSVDSERLAFRLSSLGLEACDDAAGADFIIINTCAFIKDAVTQSVQAVLEAVAVSGGTGADVIVCGCMASRYAGQLASEIPEISFIAGTEDYEGVASHIASKLSLPLAPCPSGREYSGLNPASAFLKISEGCDKECSFCVIPSIRGRQRSVPAEELAAEAAALAAQGVKELVLVAQDTGAYGTDIYGARRLDWLLEMLSGVAGIEWIRLMYVYPENVTDGLLDAMARLPKVLPYLDVPFQHASDRILRAMGRPATKASMRALIAKIRSRIPGIAIRSTFIVGFPGETEEDLRELEEFLREEELDRVGAFMFSSEEGTRAHSMRPKVAPSVKGRRLDRIMRLSEEISSRKLAGMAGTTVRVLVCEPAGPGAWSGRSYLDAPEVDGEVIFTSGRDVVPGEFVEVLVGSSGEHDLYGEAVS